MNIVLILMLVAATTATMFTLAMRVPVFSNDLRAYFGLAALPTDTDSARKAHLTFLLFLYSTPMGLGLIVSLLHFWTKRFATQTAKTETSPFDEQPIRNR